jgi:peptide/nickel transport system substrate-binding protein
MEKISRFLALLLVLVLLSVPLAANAQASPVIIRMNTSTGKGTHYDPLWFVGTGSQWHTFPWLFPGLMFYDQNGEMIPHLATNMQVNDNATVFTFTLPQNAKWTDGEPLTSADVKFSWELASNPAIKDIGATWTLGGLVEKAGITGYQDFADGKADHISGIETPDDYTVVFHLDNPNGVFVRSTYLYVMPKHILENVAIKDLADNPFVDDPNVSSGPLKFVQYQVDQFLEFDVWKDGWWPTTPQFDKIILYQSNGEPDLNRLTTGDEDLYVYGTVAQGDRFKGSSDIESIVVPGVGIQALHVNERQPKMADVRIRQGIAHALDKSTVIDLMTENTTTAIDSGIFGPDWAVSPNVTKYDYDPTAAHDLFAQAGWDFNNDVIRYLGNQDDTMALYVQQALADIGVKVTLVSTAGGSIVDIYNTGDYEMGSIGGGSLGADPAVAAGYFMCGDAGWGLWTGYCNPEFDKLAAEGTQYLDTAQRAPIYQQMSEILSNDLPWIFLYRLPVAYQKSVHLQGFVPAATLDAITWNLPEWTKN